MLCSLFPHRAAAEPHAIGRASPTFTMKVCCGLALFILASTTHQISARTWVDTIDPSVYAQAVIDPARAAMSIEHDPFEASGDKEVIPDSGTTSPTLESPTPTAAPIVNLISAPTSEQVPSCLGNETLHVIRMHDQWGDGWGGNYSMSITEIVPIMTSSDVSTTSRYHVVSISQKTFMGEGLGELKFQGSLDDGYDDFIYICLQVGTCYDVVVDGEGDWGEEIKWDITDASTCTSSPEVCYSDKTKEKWYAKGVAPAACRFSVPDQTGAFKCPLSCQVHSESPSITPTISPVSTRSFIPSDAPSLMPASQSAYPTSVVVNASATFPSQQPSFILAPSDPPSFSHAPTSSLSPSYSQSPSRFPTTSPTAHSTNSGHGTVTMDEPSPSHEPTLKPSISPTSVLFTNAPSPATDQQANGKMTGADGPAIALYDYEEDQRVWCLWMGLAEMYAGEIEAVHTNETDGSKTYDILYTDDSSMEYNVGTELLLPIDLTEAELTNRPPIEEGLRVKARYLGDIYWFDAIVEAVHVNGTSDLLYMDGDTESYVVPEYIRFKHLTDGTIPDPIPSYSPSPSPAPIQSKSPSSEPTIFKSTSFPPSNFPTNALPILTLPTDKTKSTVPSSTPTASKIPTLMPTTTDRDNSSFMDRPSEAPSQIPTGAPTKLNSVVLSLATQAPSLSPSAIPSQDQIFSMFPSQDPAESPTKTPTSNIVQASLPPSAESSAQPTAEESGLESFDVPDRLYGKITGDQVLPETTPSPSPSPGSSSMPASLQERSGSNLRSAAPSTELKSDGTDESPSSGSDPPSTSPTEVRSQEPTMKPTLSSAPTVLGRDQIRARYRSGNWPP